MSTSHGPKILHEVLRHREAHPATECWPDSTMPADPAIATTSQKGTTTEKNGRMRPTFAPSSFSRSPVTPFRPSIGVPSAPKATGAVFPMSARPAAASGRKPRPMRMVAVTATVCRIPGAFKERAEAESNQQELQPAILGNVHQAVLHYLEAASHDGEVVEEDDVDDDPTDGKQAVAGSIHCRGRRHLTGHVKGENSDEKS